MTFRFLFLILTSVTVIMPRCARTQTHTIDVDTKATIDIDEEIDQIEIDHLGNVYVLTQDNRILRYDAELELKYEYNNGQAGDISSIDATNPQKILCFVRDFNRILVLDNALAETRTIDLSTSEYFDIPAVARSNDDRIWIFDPVNQVLIKINNLGESQYISNRLSDYNLGQIDPTIIRERSNRVAMVDPSVGILIFDNFGQFIKLIPELDVDAIQIFDEYMFFMQDGVPYQYHMVRYEKTLLTLPMKQFERFKIEKDYTYFFGKSGLKRVKR